MSNKRLYYIAIISILFFLMNCASRVMKPRTADLALTAPGQILPHRGEIQFSVDSRPGTLILRAQFAWISPDSAYLQFYDLIGRRSVYILFRGDEYFFWQQRENRLYHGYDPGLTLGEITLPLLSSRLLMTLLTGRLEGYLKQGYYPGSDSLQMKPVYNFDGTLKRLVVSRDGYDLYVVKFLKYKQFSSIYLPEDILIIAKRPVMKIGIKILNRSQDLSRFKPLNLPQGLLN